MKNNTMCLYTSTGTRSSVEKLNVMNVGLLLSERWYDPKKWPFFAIDNGCYAAFSRKEQWDPSNFMKNLSKCRDRGLSPNFIVIPDIPLSEKSLGFSMTWLPVLKTMYPEFPRFLAVQDGMICEDIMPIVDQIQGIFVGGSTDWKLESMTKWVKFAHEHDIQCHVGRIGPIQRMMMCELAGVDSIDSTTWVQCRGGIDKYIGGYKAQTMIEDHEEVLQ